MSEQLTRQENKALRSYLKPFAIHGKRGLDSGAVLATITVIILIVVLGFVAISLAKGVVSIRDTFTSGTTDTLANKTLSGIAEVGNNMQTLIIIAVVVLIVALVLSIFTVLRTR